MRILAATLRFLGAVLLRLFVPLAGGALALLFFLAIPAMQSLTDTASADLIVQELDVAKLDAPPPPPPEEEVEEEPEEEPEPPELTEEAPPLDLQQLELALNPSFGDGGWPAGDFAVKIGGEGGGGSKADADALFALGDLDREPRVVHQIPPVASSEMRKRAPATVHVVFVVGKDGRVEDPKVQRSTDAFFDKAAVAAVKQWKFEPGTRSGQPVRFRMRVPITFPKG